MNEILRLAGASLFVLAVCVMSAGSCFAVQESEAPGEYEVKAAILFNFARFVEWPDSAFSDSSSPIIIGVLGEDPFGSALDAANDKTIKGRQIRIRRSQSAQELLPCHILFISRSEKANLSSLLKDLRDSGALLVGDMEKFAQRGGMINFITQNDMIDFEINVDAVSRARLKIDSRLLNMAHIIRRTQPEKER